MVEQEVYDRGIGVDSGGCRSRLQLGCTRTGRPATASTGCSSTFGAGTVSTSTVSTSAFRSVVCTCTCGAGTIWWWRGDGSSYG